MFAKVNGTLTPAYAFALQKTLWNRMSARRGRAHLWSSRRVMVNEGAAGGGGAISRAGKELIDGGDGTASSRRPVFRRLHRRPSLRAPAAAHGHADGQHAVLQHDAESAAAAYRPALLRAGNRMGSAADELAVYAGFDDRDFRERPHRRHHHRQSRHVGR